MVRRTTALDAHDRRRDEGVTLCPVTPLAGAHALPLVSRGSLHRRWPERTGAFGQVDPKRNGMPMPDPPDSH
jgi:hypothetical protein